MNPGWRSIANFMIYNWYPSIFIPNYWREKNILYICNAKKFFTGRTGCHAGLAQLVEHDLAKVGVASSSLVSRSK
jgi:hypothetical protein